MNDYFDTDVKIGDVVTSNVKTNSVRVGTKIKIEGFLDDDPNKIICKGLLPGGFISKSKLIVPIKIKKPLYYKNIVTLIKERYNFYSVIGHLLEYSHEPIKSQDLLINRYGDIAKRNKAGTIVENLITDEIQKQIRSITIKIDKSFLNGIEIVAERLIDSKERLLLIEQVSFYIDKFNELINTIKPLGISRLRVNQIEAPRIIEKFAAASICKMDIPIDNDSYSTAVVSVSLSFLYLDVLYYDGNSETLPFPNYCLDDWASSIQFKSKKTR